MRFESIGCRRDIEIVLEHRARRHFFRQLHMAAGMAKPYPQGIFGFWFRQFLLGEELVGQGRGAEIQKTFHCLLSAHDARKTRNRLLLWIAHCFLLHEKDL